MYLVVVRRLTPILTFQVVKRRVEKTGQPQERGAAGSSFSDNKRKVSCPISSGTSLHLFLIHPSSVQQRPDGSFASASSNVKSERPNTPRPDRTGQKPSAPRVDGDASEDRPAKKPRRAKVDVKNESPAKAGDSKDVKDKALGKQLGGVIGRKRKERKKGGK